MTGETHLRKQCYSAGFYFTGQVDMVSQVNNRIRSFTGVNSGLTFDLGFDLVINTLFSTIFGRRLGISWWWYNIKK